MLVVKVTEPAQGGRATEAALRALADALAVPHARVHLLRGATSRRKLVEITLDEASGEPERVEGRLRDLRDG